VSYLLSLHAASPEAAPFLRDDTIGDSPLRRATRGTTTRTVRALAHRIKRLKSGGPVADSLERALASTPVRPVWYETQKQHWEGWLREYDGAYGRSAWDRTAESVYNHIQCAPMLLWLAEAGGIPRRTSR